MNIKKAAAGVIAGAAIASAPLVAFAAPAFAATDGAKAGNDAPSHFNITPSGRAGFASEQHVLVNYTSPGSLRDGNAARCGGGINC
ncbi:MAG TPA: hypothetical protein VJR50_23315 [Mycobacterium sp.]|nr:hypothetical protein [Mycobacterium sp.]